MKEANMEARINFVCEPELKKRFTKLIPSQMRGLVMRYAVLQVVKRLEEDPSQLLVMLDIVRKEMGDIEDAD